MVCKRSDYVRKSINWSNEDEDTPFIDFTDTPITTLEDFVIWTYSAKPTISPDAKFEDVVEMAIFADIYFIEALHNQALDLLRQKLGKGVWKLQPSIVERVYAVMHSATPLRRMIRLLLHTAERKGPVGATKSPEMDLWAAVFEKSAEIGKDYYIATCERNKEMEVLKGSACYYHWHRHSAPSKGTLGSEDGCPYVNSICFMDEVGVRIFEGIPTIFGSPAQRKVSNRGKMRLQKAKSRSVVNPDLDDFVAKAAIFSPPRGVSVEVETEEEAAEKAETEDMATEEPAETEIRS